MQPLAWALLPFLALVSAQWIEYPDFGVATLTHYTLPSGFVAACGCTPASTGFPTAALSQMAYGSSTAYGPSCGRCFNISLMNPVYATPPFYPSVTKYIVVKVTDMCPLSKTGLCNATTAGPNSAGAFLNFDLAYPSSSIPNDFFPSDEALYGYTDFGVWNITYDSVPCIPNWQGANDAAALGSVKALGVGACCPADPTPGNVSNICPSFSDQNGIPPDTSTNSCVTFYPGSYSTYLVLIIIGLVSLAIV
ncbi:hypothetical protein HYPSUDRAFT_42752 [Hypholoma sublateritium FD-334 SS-4]|uniref:Uncharacterized protein n=1 Tax=Hypholoma sublateritium (strain FD-334 SS-4) TaxID=945553 RepID=A0A0D2NPK2_HYPSF|nr:hypothetical protein HYPSUDRAFT_42752 [Hypholoma sublateritium FD-334 SS-4]